MRKNRQNECLSWNLTSKSRLRDVATAAGVSLATVDRVVNDRGGVRPATAERIYSAARRLDYPRILPDRYRPTLRFDIVVQDSATPFHQALGRAFMQLGRTYQRQGVGCYQHSLRELNPQHIAAKIEEVAEQSNGLAVSVLEHPEVRYAARTAINAGTPVVTLANDLNEPQKLSYVGIDNRAAGRTAAYLLGRFVRKTAGKVALYAGSLSYLSHEQRVSGFRSAMRERFPTLVVLETTLGLDDVDTTYPLAKKALADTDLVGIYNVGAGNRGIAHALRDTGKIGDVTFIGHELTAHSRRFLLDGTMDAVIDQNPRAQAAQALDILLQYHGLADTGVARDLLPVDIVLPENLPIR